MRFNAPIALSGSEGGAPIDLDDATVPGKIIHANGATSGVVAVLANMRVRNENAQTQRAWWSVQGGSIPVPTTRDQMQYGDIPGTSQITVPTAEGFPAVVVLEPGYTLHVSTDNPGRVLQMTGAVDQYVTAGVFGYGGLVQRAPVAMADIPASGWQTIPFDEGAVTNPINVVQDAANNRLQLNRTGIWFATIYGVFSATKGNSDRIIYVRVFNETKGAPYSPNPWPIFIDNGQNAGTWSYSLLVELADTFVGDYFRMELGGSTDAFAGITLQKQGANFVLVDPAAFGV